MMDLHFTNFNGAFWLTTSYLSTAANFDLKAQFGEPIVKRMQQDLMAKSLHPVSSFFFYERNYEKS